MVDVSQEHKHYGRALWLALFLLLLATRLCHLHILWAEEGYASAAAVQIGAGKMLYRDFWFDKPPLAALIYALWGGWPGIWLRVAGAIYALACAYAASRVADHLWGRVEARLAAALIAFFLVFDIPASVITLGPDLLLVLPALAAVDCAVRIQPFRAGLWCSVGVVVNAKAVLLVAVCAVWCFPRLLPLIGGVAAGTAPWALWLMAVGAADAYWEQVWWFGTRYSRDTFVTHPLREGFFRTANWLGFHSALAAGAALALRERSGRLRWLTWILAALAAAAAGERFFPRYYFFLLPALALLAARGLSLAPRRVRCLLLALLLIPFVRFAPRYFLLARSLLTGRLADWSDLALNEDSKQAAAIVNRARQPGDTLLVWGYRPDLIAYTRLPLAGRFLDSQLLTGVIADRHLITARTSFPELAERNRAALARTHPTWIVDGLGPLNPALAIGQYSELRAWLHGYRKWGQTRDCVIYRVASP